MHQHWICMWINAMFPFVVWLLSLSITASLVLASPLYPQFWFAADVCPEWIYSRQTLVTGAREKTKNSCYPGDKIPHLSGPNNKMGLISIHAPYNPQILCHNWTTSLSNKSHVNYPTENISSRWMWRNNSVYSCL